MDLVEDGALVPLPTTAFPMSKLADAFHTMAQAKHIGKLVLRGNDPAVMIDPAEDVAAVPQPRAGPSQRAAAARQQPPPAAAARDAARRARGMAITPAQGRVRFEPFPLTDIQYSYWVGRQGILRWGNIATHFYIEIDGALDPERLERAWQRMLSRHEMLRAVVLPLGEQQVLEQPPRVPDARSSTCAACP